MRKVYFAILLICLSCSKRISDNLFFRNLNEENKDEFNYLFVEGLRYKYQGNNSEALKYFEECLKKNESNDAVYFNIAEVMLKTGNPEEARKYLIKAWKISPENIWYCYTLSEIFQQIGKADSALLFLEKSNKLNPENPEIKLQLAQLYSNLGKYKEASIIYKEIEEKYGLNENNSLIIVKNYIDSQDYKEAQRILTRLIKEHPDENLYVTLLAEVYRKTGDVKKAYEIYDSVYKKESSNPQILLWMANFLIEENNDDILHDILIEIINHEAITPEEKILTVKNLIDRTVLCKSEKLKIEEIISEVEEKIKGNYIGEILRAEYYEKAGRIYDAKEYLKDVIKRNRQNYFAWEKLLIILSDSKEYNELFNYSKDCATEFNMSFLAKIMYANAAIEIGKLDVALEELKKAKILAGNNLEANIQTRILEADIFYRMKEYEKSYEVFEEALKIDPQNSVILNNYSYYLAENDKDLKRAEKMIIEVILKEPENTIYLDTYAWVLYKQGKIKKASVIMKKIVEELKGVDPEYFEHYGFIKKKEGKCNEAVKYWKLAMEKDKNKEYLRKEIESCTGRKK
ncbi:MAG: tetratricopeptide repeat protein [Bacteroidales bacterium]